MYCHYNPEYRYSMMERAAERWHATGLWEEICRLKAIIVEERKPESFAETIAAYYDSVACGALLLAVCRGKVSEGLDFKGEKARAVFVVGLPFPSFHDTKVRLKQAYNDYHAKQLPNAAAAPQQAQQQRERVIGGGAWYKQQGFRAYNQAIGRCIRNLQDFGAVLLVDARFHSSCESAASNRAQLSRWLRSEIKE